MAEQSSTSRKEQPPLPAEVWVVFGDLNGTPITEFVAEHRYQAMEHAADAADVDDGREFAPWRVARYVLSETAERHASKPDPITDLCEQIKRDIRYCDHGYIHITCGTCNVQR